LKPRPQPFWQRKSGGGSSSDSDSDEDDEADDDDDDAAAGAGRWGKMVQPLTLRGNQSFEATPF